MDETALNYKVYVKLGSNGEITAVNSSAFLSDIEGWIQIDEGSGDKFHHAQNNYFDMPIVDENGICSYKLIDGKPAVRTKEDKTPEMKGLEAFKEIAELKAKLAETDYIAAKIAEGSATAEEYKDKIVMRQEWRKRINELESG